MRMETPDFHDKLRLRYKQDIHCLLIINTVKYLLTIIVYLLDSQAPRRIAVILTTLTVSRVSDRLSRISSDIVPTFSDYSGCMPSKFVKYLKLSGCLSYRLSGILSCCLSCLVWVVNLKIVVCSFYQVCEVALVLALLRFVYCQKLSAF